MFEGNNITKGFLFIFLITSGMFASSRIRHELFCLEQGQCQKCGIDASGE